MDVAILGASGDCGREIAGQLVASRALATTERLQLVGRKDGASARILHGLMSDLTDAHAEHVPNMDVALTPEEVTADLWVVSAGRTTPPQPGGS
jgi:malate dehydrogenase